MLNCTVLDRLCKYSLCRYLCRRGSPSHVSELDCISTWCTKKVAPCDLLLIMHQWFKIIYDILCDCWTFMLTYIRRDLCGYRQCSVSQLCSIEYCSLKIFDRFVCICKKILFLIFLQKSGNVVASLWHNFCADIFANTIKSNRLTSMPVPELTGGGIMSIYLS